tara:strand:- start:36792 stop:37169 length:378 start_codon:yes stop_codon:yes gene_type:complete
MNYLIDTHVLLWWLTDDKRLNEKARNILTEKPVWCSVVTPWEIAIKEKLGKICLPDSFDEVLKGAGFIWLDLTFKHIQELRQLPLLHKDPFDRLLIAQALHEELTLITSDQQIQDYNVPILRPHC